MGEFDKLVLATLHLILVALATVYYVLCGRGTVAFWYFLHYVIDRRSVYYSKQKFNNGRCVIKFKMDLNSVPDNTLFELDAEFLEILKSIESIETVDPFGYRKFCVRAFREQIRKKISKEDLDFLVLMFLSDKKKIDAACQVKFQSLAKKFDIQEKSNGNKHTITLFRIAQSHPELVATSLKAGPDIRGLLTLTEMRIYSEYPKFPVLGLQPLLACLLPRAHKDSKTIMNVFFLSNMVLSEKFNRKSESWVNKTKKARATEINSLQYRHYKSNIFNENLRNEWCARLMIMSDGEYAAVWIQAATKSKAKLIKTYGTSFGY